MSCDIYYDLPENSCFHSIKILFPSFARHYWSYCRTKIISCPLQYKGSNHGDAYIEKTKVLS